MNDVIKINKEEEQESKKREAVKKRGRRPKDYKDEYLIKFDLGEFLIRKLSI